AYRANAAAYLGQLDELDAAFKDVVDGAARKTIVFGDRFPFRYLAMDYNLSYFAAFSGCSTETEASAATIAFLINKVRDEGIPVVFIIELSNGKIADAICESTGAVKLELHSVHNLTKTDFENGVTYLELMRRNVDQLRQALK
ncbi:MAG: metal ABC transporter substrate-binding protein, partial [Oscillospiraceae bacterium]|nr:metal ABC transporter substrate-binding protein [Oscillospiraceae bacterium]